MAKKNITKTLRKAFAIVLTLTMLLGMIQIGVLAAPGKDPDYIQILVNGTSVASYNTGSDRWLAGPNDDSFSFTWTYGSEAAKTDADGNITAVKVWLKLINRDGSTKHLLEKTITVAELGYDADEYTFGKELSSSTSDSKKLVDTAIHSDYVQAIFTYSLIKGENEYNPDTQTYSYKVVEVYYLNNQLEHGPVNEITVTDAETEPTVASIEAEYAETDGKTYGGNAYTYTGTTANYDDTNGTVYTIRYDRTYTAPTPTTYTLVTKYVDENGEEIATTVLTENLAENTPYTTTKLDIDGYEFKEMAADSDPVNGTMDSDKEVIYVYKTAAVTPDPDPTPTPDPTTYTLVTKYVDENGEEIATTVFTPNLVEYSAYTTTKLDIDGYEFKEMAANSDPVSGTMDSDKEVIYVYKVKEVTPTPDPVIPQPQITYYYDLTVRYIDEDGAEVATTVFTPNLVEYSAYTTTKLDIDGYEFKEMAAGSDPVSGIMNADKVVTYVYSQEVVDIPDPDVPLDDDPIDIPDEDVPLVDIPDEDVPLVDIPDEDVPLVDIPDEDVPLDDVPTQDVPKTGDSIGLWIAVTVLSGMGLAALALDSKRRKEDN